MKISATIRIILYALAIVILTTIMGCFIAEDMYLNDYDGIEATEAPFVIMDQHITAQVKNIEIEWAAGSITIENDESVSEIHIEEYNSIGSDYQMVCHLAGQTLMIQYSEDSMSFPSFGIDADISKDLVITVPTNWNCNTLEIDAASADVQINDLTINDLDFDGASGELTLTNCDIVTLDIDTASGNVEFSGNLRELEFSAASANFRGDFYTVPNLLNLDAMSGDLEIILPSYAGFELVTDSMSGSFKSDFSFDVMGATYACGDRACKINVSAISGDIRILKGLDVPQSTK